MKTIFFTEAVDDAIAQVMAEDPTVIVFGEDMLLIRRTLLARFGPKRVLGAPISESAFVGPPWQPQWRGCAPWWKCTWWIFSA